MLGDDIEELEELILEMGGVIKDGEFYLKQSNESIQGSEYLMQRKKNVYLEWYVLYAGQLSLFFFVVPDKY